MLLIHNLVLISDPGKETQQVIPDPWGGDTYLQTGKDKQALHVVSNFGMGPSNIFPSRQNNKSYFLMLLCLFIKEDVNFWSHHLKAAKSL